MLTSLVVVSACPPVSLSALPPCHLSAQQPGTDVLQYTFRITLPDTGGLIHGVAAIELRRDVSAPNALLLDLVGATGLAVRDSARGRDLPFRYDGRRISVAAGRGVQHLEVRWRVAPRDGLIIRATARGRRAMFGDNWPDRARLWLPTVDHPSDKARVAWVIEAPAAWSVVANGRLVAMVDSPAGRRTWRYHEGVPIPTYTMVLGATEMTVSRHRPVRGIPVEVWAYPEDSAFADSVPFRRATAIVETMERLVGPFPYERLAHVQSSTRYGGMENASAIFYAEGGYVRRGMGEGVVRHETAHQWFGDAVTARDWHHVWLSESFATYFDAVVAQQLDGDSAYERIMRGDREGYFRSAVVDRPIVDTAITDPNDVLNANTYPKGAWVLRMLRQELGDSAFFRGVRTYYHRHRDAAVLSEDFQREMEAAAGRPLDWFFRQWLYQPGYPRLAVAWRVDALARHLVLRIRQAQPAAWGRFRMTAVPFQLLDRSGAVMGNRSFALDPRYAEQVASFTVQELPSGIRIDPAATLLLTAELRP